MELEVWERDRIRSMREGWN